MSKAQLPVNAQPHTACCMGLGIDIKKQQGMFSFSGLCDDVVAWLKENKSIYIVNGGRINIAGLTTDNIDFVCDSIVQALNAKVSCYSRGCNRNDRSAAAL